MSDPAPVVVKCPHLPAEIWVMIIEEIENDYNVTTWLNFRRVSTTLRQATEIAFQNNQLRFMEVVGTTVSTDWLPCALVYCFKRLSDDKERVVLDYTPSCYDEHEHYETALWVEERDLTPSERDLEEVPPSFKAAASVLSPELRNRLRRALLPVHTICVDGVERDTELPDLEFDAEKWQISFRWKPMLDRFFGEADYMNKLLARYLPARPEKWPRDGAGRPAMVKEHLYRLDRAHQSVDVLVRRKRFNQWCRRLNLDIATGDESVMQDLESSFKSASQCMQSKREANFSTVEYARDDWRHFWDNETELGLVVAGDYDRTAAPCPNCDGRRCEPTVRQKLEYWESKGDGAFEKYFPGGCKWGKWHVNWWDWRKHEERFPTRGKEDEEWNSPDSWESGAVEVAELCKRT